MKISTKVKRLFYAMTAPDFHPGVLLALYGIAIGGLIYGAAQFNTFALIFGAMASAGLIYLIKSGWDSYADRESIALELAAANWVRAGQSEEEKRSRSMMFESMGAAGALASAGYVLGASGNTVNIDGTPMVGGVDIYGESFGVASGDAYNFDAGDGMLLDHGSAYSDPHGMS